MALANGVARIKDSTAKSRVIIFVTDGENNSGTIDPETALDIDPNSDDFAQDSAADRIGGLDGGLGLTGASTGASGGEDGPDFDSFEGAGRSLHEHLMAQAGELLSGADLALAERIVDQFGRQLPVAHLHRLACLPRNPPCWPTRLRAHRRASADPRPSVPLVKGRG